jgi:20S proteasome subunit alpha 6
MATNPYNRASHNRPWPPLGAPSGPSTSQHPPIWHQQQPGRPPVDPAYANYGYGPRYNHPPSQPANPPMYSHPGPQQAYSPFHPPTMLQPPVPPVNPSFQSQFVAIPLPAPHPIPMAPAYHTQQPPSRAGPSFASSRVRAQQNAGGPRGPRHDRNHQSHDRSSSNNQWSNPNPPFKEGPRPVPLGPRNPGRNASLPTAPRGNRQFPQRGRGRQSNSQRRRFGPGSRMCLFLLKKNPLSYLLAEVNKGKMGAVAENTEASSSKQSSNKQENKRSFTDFKLVGWTIHDLGWTWGDGKFSSIQASALF